MSGFRRPLQCYRRPEGTRVKGVWQQPAPEPFTAECSVQPAGKEDIERLPEGQRLRASVVLFTDPGTFRTAREASHRADLVEIGADTYEVSIVDLWDNGLIPHDRAIVTRVEPDA